MPSKAVTQAERALYRANFDQTFHPGEEKAVTMLADIGRKLAIDVEPVYEAGRLEGHADVAAKLRAILDPEDAQHLTLEGLLSLVAIHTPHRVGLMKAVESVCEKLKEHGWNSSVLGDLAAGVEYVVKNAEREDKAEAEGVIQQMVEALGLSTQRPFVDQCREHRKSADEVLRQSVENGKLAREWKERAESIEAQLKARCDELSTALSRAHREMRDVARGVGQPFARRLEEAIKVSSPQQVRADREACVGSDEEDALILEKDEREKLRGGGLTFEGNLKRALNASQTETLAALSTMAKEASYRCESSPPARLALRLLAEELDKAVSARVPQLKLQTP